MTLAAAAYTLDGVVDHLTFRANYSGQNGLSTYEITSVQGSVQAAIGSVECLKPLATVLGFLDVGKIVEVKRQYGQEKPRDEKYSVFGVGDWWRLGMRQQSIEGLVGLGSNFTSAQKMASAVASTLKTIKEIAPLDEISDGRVLNFFSNKLLGALVNKALKDVSYDLTFGLSQNGKFFLRIQTTRKDKVGRAFQISSVSQISTL